MDRLRTDGRAGEDNRHMRIISPRRAVHGFDRPLVKQEPIGFLDDIVTRSLQIRIRTIIEVG